ncbi:hypothetical protein [Streptomyces sp. ISID311]|nr:hypothetical protein [Streptomyces sp. ISID311]
MVTVGFVWVMVIFAGPRTGTAPVVFRTAVQRGTVRAGGLPYRRGGGARR